MKIIALALHKLILAFVTVYVVTLHEGETKGFVQGVYALQNMAEDKVRELNNRDTGIEYVYTPYQLRYGVVDALLDWLSGLSYPGVS